MTYEGLTDEQASAQRLADRGALWRACDVLAVIGDWTLASLARNLHQALHDRDRFQRERDWWRERAA